MTTYGFKNVTCSMCGTASDQEVLMSTNSFGSPDLDLRPPEMERSTMSCWLHECHTCGFVASDLSQDEKGVRALLSDERLVSIGRGGLAGTLMGRCLKRSVLDEELGKVGSAAEHALWAAWLADDAGDPSAVDLRSRAADLFLKAIAALPARSTDSVAVKTRTIDVLRRAQRFNEALDVAEALLTFGDLDPVIRSVVVFERGLVQAEDTARHTVADAMAA